MELIDRPFYTKKILPFIGKGIIKVLTACCKYYLYQYGV